MNNQYPHLPHIESHQELALYQLIPDAVWIFDVDSHGWWWGNEKAIKFWGLSNLEELINKDLSGDTKGARERTIQTFDLAAKNGLTIDPWTTYPDGKPKTLYMRHRACLIGPEQHRAIIAFINEEVNLGEEPENLLLAEAMRYTNVLVTTFTYQGYPVVENPTATEAYKSITTESLSKDITPFLARFNYPDEGKQCLADLKAQQGGSWTYQMKTSKGVRTHTLDIRQTRHPLTGEFLFMVAEYDVTELQQALESTQQSQEKLRKMAHSDALTGVSSLHFIKENAPALLAQAKRHNNKIAVIFVDIDGFKPINDNWGHATGDIVLTEIANRLSSVLRESDQVARIGGDEFIMLITNVTEKADVVTVADKIIKHIAEPIQLSEANINVSASLGIALYPDHANDTDSLIKQADMAMYQAKNTGKNRYVFVD